MSRSSSSSTSSGPRRRIRSEIGGLGLLESTRADSVWAGLFPKNTTLSNPRIRWPGGFCGSHIFRTHKPHNLVSASEFPNTERDSRELDGLLGELSRTSTSTTSDKDHIAVLQSTIVARSAEILARQLQGTAESIGRSPNAFISALGDSTKEVKREISSLTPTLGQARADIQTAEITAARSGGRLLRASSRFRSKPFQAELKRLRDNIFW
jgi:hypothetical protein